MPLIRTEHQQRVRKVRVTFPEYNFAPEKALTVWYKPDVADEAQDRFDRAQDRYEIEKRRIEDELEDEIERGRALRRLEREHLADMFASLEAMIVDWDMYEDTDQTQKTPINGETFARMPGTMQRIQEAIRESAVPNRKPSRV